MINNNINAVKQSGKCEMPHKSCCSRWKSRRCVCGGSGTL